MIAADIFRIIGFTLAPVVMITSCVILLNGLISRMDSISGRMRSMHRERLELLAQLGTSAGAELPTAAFAAQRVSEIEYQLPNMLQRHQAVHNAVLVVGAAILGVVITMFIVAIAALTNLLAIAVIALLAFLGGTALLLVGVALTWRELARSQADVAYEVRHGLSLKPEDLR